MTTNDSTRDLIAEARYYIEHGVMPAERRAALQALSDALEASLAPVPADGDRVRMVHNHGTEDGPGLSCPEQHVDGILRGACMIAVTATVEDVAQFLDDDGAAWEAVFHNDLPDIAAALLTRFDIRPRP